VTETHVALVTGAARGIGLATAHGFHARGWRVALLDKDGPALARAMGEFSDAQRLLALHHDVAQPEMVRDAVARRQERFGRIDALINNAGVAVFKPILQTTCEDWLSVLATNLNGPFLCTQACTPLMRKTGGGSVVNIASICGLRASTLRVAYGTSKAALIHLTRQQATELGTIGIRVNCVAPGPVDTEMARQVHTRRSPKRSDSCAAPKRATSTARSSRLTAGSTPPAWACRRCAATHRAVPADGAQGLHCGPAARRVQCATLIDTKPCRARSNPCMPWHWCR
jgi:meso-butanediol dehydrogenase/(S,S)-butanediol dehydrogenase/diacetyl reductase